MRWVSFGKGLSFGLTVGKEKGNCCCLGRTFRGARKLYLPHLHHIVADKTIRACPYSLVLLRPFRAFHH